MGDEGKAGADDLKAQAIAWLVALDCGSADEPAFEAWRGASPRHAAAFAQVAATWRRTTDPRLPALLDQPVDAAPSPEPEMVVPRLVSRRAMAAGTVAAVLGGGAFLAWSRRTYASTGIGMRQTIPLPDGSHAMLNTDTQVAWRFGDTRNFWVERGEAALIVRPDNAPFCLHGDSVEARLSAGKFGIRLKPAGAEMLVLAGSADIAAYGTVVAGRMLTVQDGAAHVATLSPDAIAAAMAWESGRIVFNGMTLDRAVAEFNRYLPDKIVLQQPDLGTVRLGGAFLIDDPDAFLLGLHETLGIEHRRENGAILLFRGHR